MPRNPIRKWNRVERRRRRESLETEPVKVLKHCNVELQRRKSCTEAAYILSHDDLVVSVRANGTALSIETNWFISSPIKGCLYYIGRFAILIDPAASEKDKLLVKWLEKGCAESITPKYLISGIYFCFGIREAFLQELVERDECEYLAAVYGIFDSLTHINLGDETYIEQYYRKVIQPNPDAERRPESWMMSLFRR